MTGCSACTKTGMSSSSAAAKNGAKCGSPRFLPMILVAICTLAGYPLDSALAVASLINAQILNKFPKLRLSFSHGGGAAATVLNRMTQAWRSAPAMQKAMPQSPLEMARGFYYDTLVYEPALLRFLVELFGADRIFIGTDYPFPIRQVDPAAFLRDCGLAEGAMDAMMGGNALRFLGVNA